MDKKIIDLHSHSLFSDGSDSPTELIKKAKAIGLSAIALTDHDTVKGLDEAIAAGLDNDIEVISGVELSTFYKKKELHIVGLYIDYKDKEFRSCLDQIRFMREERNRRMCARLQLMGIDVEYDTLIEIYKSNTITRAHVADYIVKRGYCPTIKEVFETYLSNTSPACIQWEKIFVKDGIEMILKAGGVPILAHPVAYKFTDQEYKETLEELISYGLVGIECLYSTNNRSFTDKSLNLAKKYNLLVSGGSDYHGLTKPLIQVGKGMGSLNVPYSLLAPIKEKAIKQKELIRIQKSNANILEAASKELSKRKNDSAIEFKMDDDEDHFI